MLINQDVLVIIGLIGHFLFFSVLRQFKIVKLTHQPGEYKTKLPLHIVWMSNITKILSVSFINKRNTKQSVKKKNND
jgi:hypothetical protein